MFIRNISNINIFFWVFCSIAASQDNQKLITHKAPRLGTLVSISIYHSDSSKAKTMLLDVFDMLDSFDLIFSDYNPASEVGMINANQRKVSIKLSEPLGDLLEKSLWLAEASQGLFDPTLGQITRLWRIWNKRNRLPPKRKLKRAARHSGYKNVLYRKDSNEITFLKRKIGLDFGGIAKGYIADQIAMYLRQRNIESFLIDLGGDLRLGSSSSYPGWNIQIPNCKASLSLSNVSIASSGGTFQYIEGPQGGQSHIINLAKTKGVSPKFITVVFAEQAWIADALATAINASEHNWIPAELISQQNGFFIHRGDPMDNDQFNTYISQQLNKCK